MVIYKSLNALPVLSCVRIAVCSVLPPVKGCSTLSASVVAEQTVQFHLDRFHYDCLQFVPPPMMWLSSSVPSQNQRDSLEYSCQSCMCVAVKVLTFCTEVGVQIPVVWGYSACHIELCSYVVVGNKN